MKIQRLTSLVAGLALACGLVGCEGDSTAPATTAANSDAAKNDAAKNDVAKNDVAKNDAAKNDDATESNKDAADSSTATTNTPDNNAADTHPVAVAGEHDWPQWGGSPTKNNTPADTPIPSDWEPGDFNDETGEWIPGSGKNIKWVSRLGSQTYGNPVIANGQVYVGTNNGAGYLERYPFDVDLGVLLCFRESDGEFLWQHSNEKLIIARVQDWPLQGICCAPCVEGDRLWYVTSRGTVVCLDTQGFRDGENDGPVQDEKVPAENEADVIWEFDMLKEIQLFQHNMCACSVTISGDYLFVNTSNGVDESHINIPSPDAPSFMAMNKNTGEVIWTDNSPGVNIVHGQWSSPAYAVINGRPQVIFPGGDGYIRSFDPAGDGQGNAKLLWKFDCNPKESKWILGGRGTRNNLISTAVVYDDKVYIVVGQDPEHGEGEGHMWCIDPTKDGDISPTLAVDSSGNPLPHRRLQAVDEAAGERAVDNPNSGAIWHYNGTDLNGNGKLEWEESLHRSVATCTIKDDLLYVADFSGLFHCVDAQTGKAYWTYDMLSDAWGSALVVDGKVIIGDGSGEIMVFKHGKEMEVLTADINMGNAVYSTPVVANGVMYIANKSHLFAIVPEGASETAPAQTPQQ